MQGTWILVAPNGREYTGESPLRCVKSELDERVPKSVQLARLRFEVDKQEAEDGRRLEVAERMVHALAWYRDEAKALAKHLESGAHTQAVLASLTVLALDAGRRADKALAEWEALK
jgi:hypothetical protein